jgi:hypothetical protein
MEGFSRHFQHQPADGIGFIRQSRMCIFKQKEEKNHGLENIGRVHRNL